MKHLFIIIILFGVINVKAQDNFKADSAYYLLDTSKTLPSDKLWHTYNEGLVKSYELEIYAPCSALMNKPTFVYSSRFQQPKIVNKSGLKAIKISSLSELIYKLKQFADEDRSIKPSIKRSFYLYIIKPKPGGYTVVKTQLDGSGPKSIVN